MSTKLSTRICVIFIFIITVICISITHAADNINYYLSKPTGVYGVGFQDFHWINQNVCPDPNFNMNNKDDFSANNPNFCHEIMVRIYYPTIAQQQPIATYYLPFIRRQQEIFREIPSFPPKQIEQLNQIKSYAAENSPIVKAKKFPVLLFSPGFGCPAEMYENFITELVSHGYIVVGINTPFINLVALPNEHIVKPAKPKSREEIEDKFVVLQSQDLMYVFDQLKLLHNSDLLFSSMELNHVGLFGHSIGARVLADVSHASPANFQAAVTLDIGFDTTGASRKKFAIPFMHEISAKLKDAPWPFTFELGDNNYLVGFTPNEKDYEYSYHMNFSDLSTLRYLPAFITYQNYLRATIMDGFSLKLMSHNPTEEDTRHFGKAAYVLIKRDQWIFAMYNGKNKIWEIEATAVKKGLDIALANLPNKAPEELSDDEIAAVRYIVMSIHRLYAELFGTANGWDLTNSINTNLVQFFDTFLKGQENPAFKQCLTLSKDTYIKCGPGPA